MVDTKRTRNLAEDLGLGFFIGTMLSAAYVLVSIVTVWATQWLLGILGYDYQAILGPSGSLVVRLSLIGVWMLIAWVTWRLARDERTGAILSYVLLAGSYLWFTLQAGKVFYLFFWGSF